jgi:hypothetical protein
MESQAGLRYAHTGRAGRARNERGARNPIRSVLDVGGAHVLSHYIQLNGRRGDIPGDPQPFPRYVVHSASRCMD